MEDIYTIVSLSAILKFKMAAMEYDIQYLMGYVAITYITVNVRFGRMIIVSYIISFCPILIYFTRSILGHVCIVVYHQITGWRLCEYNAIHQGSAWLTESQLQNCLQHAQEYCGMFDLVLLCYCTCMCIIR